MLIEYVLNHIYNVFSFLTTPIDIPDMPPEVQSIFSEFMEYINFGLSIVAAYTHLEYLLILFSIVISVEVGIMLYKLVMWIIKKIPFLGIE